jgi:hypothetical protein
MLALRDKGDKDVLLRLYSVIKYANREINWKNAILTTKTHRWGSFTITKLVYIGVRIKKNASLNVLVDLYRWMEINKRSYLWKCFIKPLWKL